MTVRAAAGWYSEKDEPRFERGTMDVRPFAARRSAVLSAAENAAAAHGVHHARASRVVEFALERYAAHRSKGAGHGSSRDAASDAGRCCPFTGRWPIRLGAAGRYSGVSCRFRLAPRQPRPVGGSFLTRAPLFPGESARKLAGRQPSTLGPMGPRTPPPPDGSLLTKSDQSAKSWNSSPSSIWLPKTVQPCSAAVV